MNHVRHLGIYSAYDLSVTLIGAGGIGALTAVVLGKMGVGHLKIADDDIVEDINLSTQFHPIASVGMLKTVAAGTTLQLFSDDTEIELGPWRVERDDDPELITNPIIISAVDSIEVRKDIWSVVQKTHALWYLDARMSAEDFQLYTVDMQDSDWYNQGLGQINEADVPELPCTSKATIFTAAAASGVIGSVIRRIATGESIPKLITYDVHNFVMMTP